jgi:phosphomannomutase
MADNRLIISVSGLRGIVGETLTLEVAQRYTAAFLSQLPPGPIVVTRDGRTTGAMLGDAVRAAVVACGRDLWDGKVAATPTTGVLVQELQAAGGIQISASHNPPQYNGLKLFDGAGRVIPADAGERVLAAYQSGEARWSAYDEIGTATSIDEPEAAHLQRVLAVVDVPAIQRARFRVVLDANHGSGSCLGRPLLEALGCEVVVLGGTADGRFEHVPEPTAQNLQSVLECVPAERAAVGFCQDPDADRLAIIDEAGRYLGEEYTLAICASAVLGRSPGPVVTNCSTSRMTEDLAQRYGVPFTRTRVGEANVVDAMLASGAVLGGEGNGGVIHPAVGLVRDSFVGMAIVLDAMARRGLPVSALADELPRYAIHKTKIELGAKDPAAGWERLASAFPEARCSRLDGLRLDWPDGAWLLVRASNTEPIVRAIAEAPTPSRAAELCAAAADRM